MGAKCLGLESFGNKYDRCIYDQYYDEYRCLSGTR
jgi:hypothetical protein